jgi:hypothetical protein
MLNLLRGLNPSLEDPTQWSEKLPAKENKKTKQK